MWLRLPRRCPQIGPQQMPRNAGNFFNVPGPFGGDPGPHGDRGLREPNPGRKPGDEATLGTQEIHPDHITDISDAEYQSQGENIGLSEEDPVHNEIMDLGTRIREARLRLGLKQTDLARRLRVKQSAISQWESNKFAPDVENRVKLAQALHIALQDIMPDAPANVSGDLLRDPQVRRILDNFAALDRQQRSLLDILAQQLRERNEQALRELEPPEPPDRTTRARRR